MDSAALDLLNSDYRDYRSYGRREDRLEKDGWVREFAARWGFSEAGDPSPSDIGELRTLRDGLRRIVESLVRENAPADTDIALLNDAMSACATLRTLERDGARYRLERTPIRRDWQWIRSEVAGSFAEMLASVDPRRIKMCENENCRWVFCDESKSRSRRWCEHTCGNLVKVRRFRQRQARREAPNDTQSRS